MEETIWVLNVTAGRGSLAEGADGVVAVLALLQILTVFAQPQDITAQRQHSLGCVLACAPT